MSKHDDQQQSRRKLAFEFNPEAMRTGSVDFADLPKGQELLACEDPEEYSEILEEMADHIPWCWEEAFHKFGYNDGQGPEHTGEVACVLRDAGYEVETITWGMHNTIIEAISDGSGVLMSFDKSHFDIGYDDPRGYLPSKIVRLLDRHFPSGQDWKLFER